jgi:hypothetical protein
MQNFKISPNSNNLLYEKSFNPFLVRKLIEDNSLSGLAIFTDLKEQRVDDFDFLSKYPFLEQLSISSIPDHEYDFLKHLPLLKSLNIQNEGISPIDLSSQVNLENLGIQWRKSITGFECLLKLKRLCLIHWKEQDLSNLKHLENLEELLIKTSSLKTLTGIEGLKKLTYVSVANSRFLDSISLLNKMPMLQRLEIEASSKIDDYDNLTDLPHLEELVLTNCKNIKSIKFVKNFHKLKRLFLLGNTFVDDNDLTPAKDIEDVICPHKKSYNIKLSNPQREKIRKQNLNKLLGKSLD